jgi:hypothetical protein
VFEQSLLCLQLVLADMGHLPKLIKQKTFNLVAMLSRRGWQDGPTRRKRDERSGVQDIAVVDIDPEKLMEKLRMKFPAGFEVHVSWLFDLIAASLLTQKVVDDA